MTISPGAKLGALQSARRVRAMDGAHQRHHLPATSFEQVISEVKAKYVVGLTATPQRRDGRHPIT
ncbi:MAG: hypothetical protein U9Q75_06625 [Pseudomonadota bacterium]|nr:hypothetical protein [Pseudomonadota bacterium]